MSCGLQTLESVEDALREGSQKYNYTIVRESAEQVKKELQWWKEESYLHIFIDSHSYIEETNPDVYTIWLIFKK